MSAPAFHSITCRTGKECGRKNYVINDETSRWIPDGCYILVYTHVYVLRNLDQRLNFVVVFQAPGVVGTAYRRRRYSSRVLIMYLLLREVHCVL
jgi:hypothetical protein